MINKMGMVIAELEKKLKAAGIRAIVRYPEHYGKIGNLYPMAIIKEGNHTHIIEPGNRYVYWMEVSVSIVGNFTQNRMEQMQKLQVAVFNELFPDNTMGGLVMNINPVSVQTGEIMKGSDLHGYAGFTEAASFRVINMKIQVQDARR